MKTEKNTTEIIISIEEIESWNYNVKWNYINVKTKTNKEENFVLVTVLNYTRIQGKSLYTPMNTGKWKLKLYIKLKLHIYNYTDRKIKKEIELVTAPTKEINE